MSRGSSRRRSRKSSGGPFAAARARQRSMWLRVGVIALGLVAVSLLAGRKAEATHHPQPREVGAKHVQSAQRYAQYPRVAETYTMAAAVPAVLDGIYCYCQCSKHSGHYSLLDCFNTDHAARCDICMSEATLAYKMTQKGQSLDAIRKEVDRTFGS